MASDVTTVGGANDFSLTFHNCFSLKFMQAYSMLQCCSIGKNSNVLVVEKIDYQIFNALSKPNTKM